MSISNQVLIKNRQEMKIESLSFDKDNLREFCQKLQERAITARDIEISGYVKGDVSGDKFESDKKILSEGFVLKITVKGDDGEELLEKLMMFLIQ